MALLAQTNNHILITLNREVLFINEEGEVKNKLVLPFCVRKEPTKAELDEDEHEKNDTKISAINDVSKIQHIAMSNSGELLAVTTSGDKILYLYRVLENSTELISKRELSRVSNSVNFSPDSSQLLVADKTGDCYVFDCNAPDTPGKWVLAHFSMVLGILFTPSLTHIVTCDRDEKIRLTNYPKTHIIETYCLGHTEYVAAIAFLPTHTNEIIVSISGDKTMKLWQYNTGIELCSFELPAPALKFAVKKLDKSSHVAVTFFDHSYAIVYEISSIQDNQFVSTEITRQNLGSVRDVAAVLFDNAGNLLVSVVSDTDKPIIHKFSYSESKYQPLDVAAWNANIEDITVQFNAEDNLMLFKKKFDNIHDYQERKKRRIEEKNKRN